MVSKYKIFLIELNFKHPWTYLTLFKMQSPRKIHLFDSFYDMLKLKVCLPRIKDNNYNRLLNKKALFL